MFNPEIIKKEDTIIKSDKWFEARMVGCALKILINAPYITVAETALTCWLKKNKAETELLKSKKDTLVRAAHSREYEIFSLKHSFSLGVPNRVNTLTYDVLKKKLEMNVMYQCLISVPQNGDGTEFSAITRYILKATLPNELKDHFGIISSEPQKAIHRGKSLSIHIVVNNNKLGLN